MLRAPRFGAIVAACLFTAAGIARAAPMVGTIILSADDGETGRLVFEYDDEQIETILLPGATPQTVTGRVHITEGSFAGFDIRNDFARPLFAEPAVTVVRGDPKAYPPNSFIPSLIYSGWLTDPGSGGLDFRERTFNLYGRSGSFTLSVIPAPLPGAPLLLLTGLAGGLTARARCARRARSGAPTPSVACIRQ